jgi:hypothetical protein
VTTVTTGGTAPGNEFFAAEGHTAIAAISSFYTDFRFIDKHLSLPSVAEAA